MKKKVLLILPLLLPVFRVISPYAFATKDTVTHNYTLVGLRDRLRDTLWIDKFFQPTGQPRTTGYPAPQLKEAMQTLSLFIEPEWDNPDWRDQRYKAVVSGYLPTGIPGLADTSRFSLSVEYDIRDSRPYKSKDVVFNKLSSSRAYTIAVIEEA